MRVRCKFTPCQNRVHLAIFAVLNSLLLEIPTVRPQVMWGICFCQGVFIPILLPKLTLSVSYPILVIHWAGLLLFPRACTMSHLVSPGHTWQNFQLEGACSMIISKSPGHKY